MICKKAEYSDLFAVEALEKECFRQPWNFSMLSDSFTSGCYHAFVVTDGDSVVGYAGMRAVYEDGDLDQICVKTEYRRKGLASMLMNAVLKEAEGLEVGKLFLEVRRSNLAAQKLYEKFGFVKISERAHYYENGEDALIYCKEIAKI